MSWTRQSFGLRRSTIVAVADHTVLREKFRVPEPSGLARERIEQPLREAEATSLGLVVAPAGAGKTTLLSRVAATSAGPVGWYRLMASDFSERALVAHLVEALKPITGDLGPVAVVDTLLSGLDHWDGPGGVLFLDDVHEIAGQPSEHALERFISLCPPRLRLILGSRREPGVNVPRLRVSGTVREVAADDLRFRSWEVEELFATVYREPLRPEAAAALTRRTGGWAAGLQLFHLSTTGRGDRERHRAVAELAGRSRLIRSYLTRNVLADLPDRQRRFLMRTCTLGRLSGSLCDSLLGTSGSARILEDLERRQMFTSSTGDGGEFYAYHEVLSTHLELALVENYGAGEARAWYARSGEVLESAHEYRAAVRAYAKADDWNSVSRLVRTQSGADIGVHVDDDVLLASVEWQQDPWLALARAKRLVRNGAFHLAAAAFRHATTLFDDPEYQELVRRESGVLPVWSTTSRSHRARSREARLAHWSAPIAQALHGIPDDLSNRDPTDGPEHARLCTGLIALIDGDLCMARKALATITDDPSAEEMASITAGLVVDLIDTVTGAHLDPGAYPTEYAARADDAGLPWLSRIARGLQVLVLMSARSEPWRLDAEKEMVVECERTGDAWGAALIELAAAFVSHLLRDDEAVSGFGAVGRRFADLDAPVLALWCRVIDVSVNRPVAEPVARAALADSERLGVRGAQVLSMAALAASGADPRYELAARRLAEECGMPLSWLAPVRSGRRAGPPPAAGLPAPALRISCFGEYQIAVGGRRLDLARLRPQARTLLRLISMAPERDHHREFLEEQIWPGTDHTVAGHRLQVAISSVRGLLAGTGGAVRRCGQAYRLCLPSGSAIDVIDFDAAIRDAATASARGDIARRMRSREAALALYTDDLLPDDIVTEHIASERERLRREAVAAATALANDHRCRDDRAGAEQAARRALELDPDQELPWEILADVFEAMGDIGSATHARQERDLVRAGLGLAPG
jgi:DNA-binding SARP family transcriptional activator